MPLGSARREPIAHRRAETEDLLRIADDPFARGPEHQTEQARRREVGRRLGNGRDGERITAVVGDTAVNEARAEGEVTPDV